MSASITSGTYGHQPLVSGAIRQVLRRVLGQLTAVLSAPSQPALAAASVPGAIVNSFRVRAREANDVRELARSVELHSPGFAADLYAAAARHEGYDD